MCALPLLPYKFYLIYYYCILFSTPLTHLMGYTQERTKQASRTGDDQVTKTEKEHCRVSSFADGLELNLFRKELTVVLPPPPSAICCNMQSPFDPFTIYLLLSEYVLISRRHFVARVYPVC